MSNKDQKRLDPRDIFTDLAVVMAKHSYRPTEEETKNVLRMRSVTSLYEVGAGFAGCALAWNVSGMTALRRYRGGRLMLTILSFPYATAVGGRHAGKRCLRMLAQQPGPMGGEVCELIRERDPDSPLLRDVPSRMEGDPRARIAPWGSSEDRAAHSEDLHSSASPEAQQQAQDAQPSSRGAPAHEEGMQAPGWGDVGDFSMGTLDAPSIAADDQSSKAEPQQHHSHRLRRAEERRQRRQQQHQGIEGSAEELQDYFDRRWEEPSAR